MKRWIRRILMGCSIALMIIASLLCVRGFIVEELLVYRWLEIENNRVGVGFDTNGRDHWGGGDHLFLVRQPPNFRIGLRERWPEARSYQRQRPLWIPHWVSIIVGAAYPTFVWLRHRKPRVRRKVGFPIETRRNAE